MEKQISLILKRHKEMIQEETGIKSSFLESDMKIMENARRKIVYPVYVISCIKIRDESGKGMR